MSVNERMYHMLGPEGFEDWQRDQNARSDREWNNFAGRQSGRSSTFKESHSMQFGNQRPQVIKGAKRKERRNGKMSFPRAFVEIKGNLYKIEVGPANKEGVEHWITVTDYGRNNGNGGGSSFGGGQRRSRGL